MTTKELNGITHELSFWQNFIKTDRFINGWVADCKTPELNDYVADFILTHKHESVLDVGSGAVSILNGLVPNVTAYDPLGGLYGLIFDYKKYGVTQPVAIPVEEINETDKYDIVHCSNALDHTQNPFMALKNMSAAVKGNGYMIIQGFENEATFEHWEGFHQWNISVNETDMLITDGSDNTTSLPGFTKRIKLPNGKTWFIWIA